MGLFFSWQHAIREAKIEPTTKLVLYTIATRMAADGSGCFPSYQTIADESGLSRSTVILHVKKAVDANLLEPESRQRKDGGDSSNNYKPMLPSPADGLGESGKQTGGSPADGPLLTDQYLTDQVTTPSISPSTKEKKNASRGQRLEQYLERHEQLPPEWEDWSRCNLGWVNDKPWDVWVNFLDYWRAAPGAKGIKSDWFATWRNWCRRENDKRGASRQAWGDSKPSRFDAIRSAAMAIRVGGEGLDGGETPDWLKDANEGGYGRDLPPMGRKVG